MTFKRLDDRAQKLQVVMKMLREIATRCPCAMVQVSGPCGVNETSKIDQMPKKALETSLDKQLKAPIGYADAVQGVKCKEQSNMLLRRVAESLQDQIPARKALA